MITNKDNLHGVWSRAVKDLALTGRVSQDSNAFALFNGGLTTTLTADGNAWFSTHTLINGQTYANTTATLALTEGNLNTAIIGLRNQPNQANVVLGNVPSYLVVPPALFKKAIQYTESALIPDVSDNNINVYRSAYGIQVFSTPYLGSSVSGGSDTAWFLLARNHGVTRLIRQGIQTSLRPWEYSNNRTYFYQANFRESVYVPDYIGSWGTAGA